MENQIKDPIEQFLEQLNQDHTKPRTEFKRLNKLTLSAQDKQGTVTFAPVMSPTDSAFYKKFSGVREVLTSLPMYKEGKEEIWCKILEKSCYGKLTKDEESLYDEVTGMFDQLQEILSGKSPKSWQVIRWRTYSIFQGIVLKHTNASGIEIADNKGISALLIYPSASPVDRLQEAIANTVAMANSKAWVSAVFSPTPEGRQGAISISFSKSQGAGYDCQVSIPMNGPLVKVIPDDFSIPEDTMKLFGDFTSSFIGWENDNDNNRVFNVTFFEQLRDNLRIQLSEVDISVESKEIPKNNNGKDPVIDAQPATEQSKDPFKFPFGPSSDLPD